MAQRKEAGKPIDAIAHVNNSASPADKMLHETTIAAAETTSLDETSHTTIERAECAEWHSSLLPAEPQHSTADRYSQ